MKNVDILEQALNVATQKGAFTLSDAAKIINALAGVRAELEQKEIPKKE